MIGYPSWRDEYVWERRSGIYFLGGSRLTKIGHSHDIISRCRTIQQHCPERLELVAFVIVEGKPDDRLHAESWIHQRLWPYREHCEWFQNAGVRDWLSENYWTVLPAPVQQILYLNRDWPA